MQYIPRYKVSLVREGSVKCVDKNITCPQEVYHIIKDEICDLDREHFIALFLDVKNKVIGVNTVSIGTLNASSVHPRELFKPAILCNSAGVILVHNHPSGDNEPSNDDIKVTQRLKESGDIVGIEVLDHLVVSEIGYTSMKEKNFI